MEIMSDAETWLVVLICVATSLSALILMAMCCVCKTKEDCSLHKYCPIKLAHRHTKLRKSQSHYGSTGNELLPVWRDRGKNIQDWSNTSDDDVIELSIVGVKQWAATRDGTIKIMPLDCSIDVQRFYRGGLVEISMQYDNALLLNVLSVCGLVTDEHKIDMYFVAKLYRHSPLSRRLLLLPDNERRTRTQRGGSYTRFNQTLKFDIDQRFMKSRLAVKISLYEVDEYSRHLLSGECLTDINIPSLFSKHGSACQLINEPLMQPKQDYLGELKMAISYLPLAEKIIVSVVAGHGLLKADRQKITSDIYFRVALMTGTQQLRKHRTSSYKNISHLGVGETFTFELPRSQLSTTYVMVAVMEDIDGQGSDSRHRSSSHEPKYTTTTLISNSSLPTSTIKKFDQVELSDLSTTALTVTTPTTTQSTFSITSPITSSHHNVSCEDEYQPKVTTKSIVVSKMDVIRCKTSAIGRMYVGSMFEGLALTHWQEMTNNIRKHVTCWHRLY